MRYRDNHGNSINEAQLNELWTSQLCCPLRSIKCTFSILFQPETKTSIDCVFSPFPSIFLSINGLVQGTNDRDTPYVTNGKIMEHLVCRQDFPFNQPIDIPLILVSRKPGFRWWPTSGQQVSYWYPLTSPSDTQLIPTVHPEGLLGDGSKVLSYHWSGAHVFFVCSTAQPHYGLYG